MRNVALALAGLLFVSSASAQSADEIIARYIKTIGGAERVSAIQSLRRSGRFTGGGGFEAKLVEENKRPNLVRQEFTFSGMTGVTAYDGKAGWKIEPWGGKKDPEALSEEEMKSIVEDSDLDGPLVDYAKKGNKVEYIGMEAADGTDAYKLKVTMPTGDTRYYYMDTDYFVPIKVELQRMVRGAPREYETVLGDYKEVNGVYFPFSLESGQKGSANRQKITYDRIEANVDLPEARFHRPPVAGEAPDKQPGDASEVKPKKQDEKKPAPSQEAKPPAGK